MHFLAISGSLRAASINSALLRATARLAPSGIRVVLSAGIGDFPLFNPDIESPTPAAVGRFMAEIAAADALIIASPEYAHGVPGPMKNALDWLVCTELFIDKPVALFNASPLSTWAPAALHEIVSVMSARIVRPACITLQLRGARMGEDAIVYHAQMAAQIRAALEALRDGAGPRTS
jgi:chromate reductase